MKKTTGDIEGNRTGAATAPKLAAELVEGAVSAGPNPDGGPETADSMRAVYITSGFPLGSLPDLPFSEEPSADEETMGMAVFMDKLSERAAYERTGTRLYDAVIRKCEALQEIGASPSLAELQEIRDEEHRHFVLLSEAITSLGGDPTVMSPCADVQAVASLGLMQVLNDPRTSVTQSLNVLLTAELTDNAGWEMLIDLAEELGHDDLVDQFTEALNNEQRHLLNVQTWVSERLMAKV